jgi:hypothetical protein
MLAKTLYIGQQTGSVKWIHGAALFPTQTNLGHNYTIMHTLYVGQQTDSEKEIHAAALFFLRWFRSQSHYDAFDTIVNFFVSFYLECFYSSLFALSSSLCVLCVESLITCFKFVNYVWGHEEFCLCFAEILMCCSVAWRSETDVDALEATKEERRAEEALHAASLTIPRRFLYFTLWTSN